MPLAKLCLLGAAGAGLLYLVNSQSLPFIIIGSDARLIGRVQPPQIVCTNTLEPSLKSVERRLDELEVKLSRSDRRLSAAKAALMLEQLEIE